MAFNHGGEDPHEYALDALELIYPEAEGAWQTLTAGRRGSCRYCGDVVEAGETCYWHPVSRFLLHCDCVELAECFDHAMSKDD